MFIHNCCRRGPVELQDICGAIHVFLLDVRCEKNGENKNNLISKEIIGLTVGGPAGLCTCIRQLIRMETVSSPCCSELCPTAPT